MKRMFHEHYLKVQTQQAMDKTERKKRQLELPDFLSPASSRSSTLSRSWSRMSRTSESSPVDIDQSSPGKGPHSVFEATNAAMNEICLNLKAKRLEREVPNNPNSLSVKDRIELLQYLILHGTEEQKKSCLTELFVIAGL